MFPLPMQYILRLFGIWPGYKNNVFFFIFVLTCTINLVSQFWNVTTVYNNLELLSINISNIIMVLTVFTRIVIFWMKRR